jgi:hypothetical protein
MLMGMSKKIELVANLAIIVVACLLGTVLVRNHLFTRPSVVDDSVANRSKANSQFPGVSPLKAGSKLSGPDMEFAGETLILAISSTCHFCTESASFYKTLGQTRGNIRLVAVMPQPVEDGRKYLEKLGVSVDEVRQLPLERLGVQGTPTLILVDASGVVRNSWMGFLPPEAELVVFKALKGA